MGHLKGAKRLPENDSQVFHAKRLPFKLMIPVLLVKRIDHLVTPQEMPWLI